MSTRGPNKKSPRAKEFLKRVTAGEEKSYGEWADEFYGDSEMRQCIISLCRTLKKHGHYIAPVDGSNENAGKLKLYLEDPSHSSQIEQRYSKDINTRLENYSDITPRITTQYPGLHDVVLKNIEKIMLITLETKQALALVEGDKLKQLK